MVGFEVLRVEASPGAITAEVRFTAADGRRRENRYSWPAATSREEILRILAQFYQEFEAEGARAAPDHLGLAGYRHEADPPRQAAEAAQAGPPADASRAGR
ncbi:MAG: hypothetical protein HY613_05340 [Candidatus Rokubacteria bacterium]|nr:hypothetical protein [Candidatus Rokubacteria bacterium]